MNTVLEDSHGADAAAAAAGKRGRPRRQYRCKHCLKTFKRSEHCVRHERTHTNEKPFACRYCKKAYSRKDLVTRHERTLHTESQAATSEGVHVTAAANLEQEDRDTSPSEDSFGADRLEDGGRGNASSSDTGERRSVDGYNDAVMEITVAAKPSTRDDKAGANRIVDKTTSNGQTSISSLLDQTSGTDPVEPAVNIYLDLNFQRAGLDECIVAPPAHARASHEPLYTTETRESLLPPSFMDIDLDSFALSPTQHILTSLEQGEHYHSLVQDYPQLDFRGSFAQEFGPLPMLEGPDQQSSGVSRPSWEVRGRRKSCSDGSRSSCSNSTAESPVLIRDGPRSLPAIAVRDETLSSIKSDLARRLGVADLKDEIDMPSPKMCEDFLASYIANFHTHFPIIHFPTFYPSPQCSPLFLIMCSIGALYRMDRRRARSLHYAARRAIERADPPPAEQQPSLVKDYPLWFMQTRVLLSFYGIMCGDADLVSTVMRENGVYTIVYQRAKQGLHEHRGETSRLGWHRWAYIESWKRLMGGVLILSTMCMVIYHVNPGMNSTLDLDFDAFHDEKLWRAQTSAEWQDVCSRIASQQNLQQIRTMKDILTDIMMQNPQQKQPSTVYPVSAYTGLVLTHAIVVHMWQRAQVCQVFANDTSGLLHIQEGLGDVLISSGLQTLTRCQQFLDSARNEAMRDSSQSPGPWCDKLNEEKETSLVFDSYAILRIAHTRLIASGSTHSFIDLANLHGPGIEVSIASFVNSRAERSTMMLEAVAKAFDGMREPVRMGHLLVRKTAAFRWSVEQAVAGWDCALLVSKWVHGIEMAILEGKKLKAGERKMMDNIREVLREAECDVDDGGSLAAAVAGTWSWFLKDVWIWGITPVMGATLDRVAEVFRLTLASHSFMYSNASTNP